MFVWDCFFVFSSLVVLRILVWNLLTLEGTKEGFWVMEEDEWYELRLGFG